MNSLLDSASEWLIRALQERRSGKGSLHRAVRWLRRGSILCVGAYLAGLIAYMLLARFLGERHATLAFLLYAPQQALLLPVVVLFPISLFAGRLWFALLLLGALLFAGPFMGFTWSHPRPPGAGAQIFTVIANNRGEDNHQSFTSFVHANDPDFLVLQEDGRADAFKAAYPTMFAKSEAGFTLVSRYPITSSGLIYLPASPQEPIAAWFAVEPQNVPLIIYSVHLPTPRQNLMDLRGPAVLLPILGWGSSRLAAHRQAIEAPWKARLELAQQFADVLARENQPFIAAGDFNMPSWGRVHRLFAGTCHDSFAEAGRGWGFSFPGETRDPLSAFGPWLRIDYVFGGPGFRAISAATEPDRTSQHRCVVARLAREPVKSEVPGSRL